MKNKFSLSDALDSLHQSVEGELSRARHVLGAAHSTSLGDASEDVWIKLFNDYLPSRYRATKAMVVDSKGIISEQIDVVIHDRQYSPLIFELKGQEIVAAESVYAVFESKQEVNAKYIAQARRKAKSVRKLHRTSIQIPHAGGEYPAKPPGKIIAGILTLDSAWNPPLGDPLKSHLLSSDPLDRLDIGCVASHGYFEFADDAAGYVINQPGKNATAFLYRFFARLQALGTVPMVDISAYSKWL